VASSRSGFCTFPEVISRCNAHHLFSFSFSTGDPRHDSSLTPGSPSLREDCLPTDYPRASNRPLDCVGRIGDGRRPPGSVRLLYPVPVACHRVRGLYLAIPKNPGIGRTGSSLLLWNSRFAYNRMSLHPLPRRTGLRLVLLSAVDPMCLAYELSPCAAVGHRYPRIPSSVASA